MKIHPVGAELFRVDRRADIYDEANSSFLQFCEIVYKMTEDKMILTIVCNFSFLYRVAKHSIAFIIACLNWVFFIFLFLFLTNNSSFHVTDGNAWGSNILVQVNYFMIWFCVAECKSENTFSTDIDMAFEIDVINKHKCQKYLAFKIQKV